VRVDDHDLDREQMVDDEPMTPGQRAVPTAGDVPPAPTVGQFPAGSVTPQPLYRALYTSPSVAPASAKNACWSGS
jgi:hypothetical protein